MFVQPGGDDLANYKQKVGNHLSAILSVSFTERSATNIVKEMVRRLDKAYVELLGYPPIFKENSDDPS